TASTEANAAAVGPVTQLDIAAPTGPNPEAAIPSGTVVAVAPSEADAEQEVRFVSAAAAAPTGPDAGSEIARGGRRVVEAPAPGPTPWGLEGGGEAPAIRPGRAERAAMPLRGTPIHENGAGERLIPLEALGRDRGRIVFGALARERAWP
ncbi:MAG: hypothetical protein JO034_02485, partial [Singulisphaera sp.]|nr:hypothetical protein [Singulisphaera sp.]